jgi:hypothetical protein
MAENSLATGIEMLGLAKQDEQDDNAILLSSPPNCESWTKVRIDTIDQLRVIAPAFRCQDHEHPLILFRLKEPEAGTKSQLTSLVSELLKPQPPGGGPIPLLRRDGGGLPDPTGSGGAPSAGAALSVSFGVDIIGPQPSTVRVTATGHVVNPDSPPGGSVMFNVSQTFSVNPGPSQYLTVVARGLQAGTWCVWASSNISGGAGPCEARVPGIVYLGVDGGAGPHCGVAFAGGTIATLGTPAISN